MRSLLAAACLFATAALGALPLPAAAQAAPRTQWVCAVSGDLVRLECRSISDPRDAAPDEAPGTDGRSTGTATTAVVNGTRFPLEPERTWYVEMWSPPNEPEFVELLARATICYRSPGCSVQVLPWSDAFGGPNRIGGRAPARFNRS